MGRQLGSVCRSNSEAALHHPYTGPFHFQEALHLLPSDCGCVAAEGSASPASPGIQCRIPLKVQRPDHHGGGVQGVAGAFEVMPLDAVELAVVLSSCVEHPIEIGGATGVKPPP